MRFERRDLDDWFHSRRLPERIPVFLVMLLALVGVGAIIMAGLNAPPAQVGSLDGGAPVQPPGGELATPMPVPLPVEEEMTVIEPVKVVERPLDLRAYERAIYEEVNKRRVENGLQPLIWDDRIADVARKHSEDMAARGYFSHTDPEGKTPWNRLPMAAENILLPGEPFQYYLDVDWWMGSPAHRANILNRGLTQTGVGVAINKNGQVYVTQNFIS